MGIPFIQSDSKLFLLIKFVWPKSSLRENDCFEKKFCYRIRLTQPAINGTEIKRIKYDNSLTKSLRGPRSFRARYDWVFRRFTLLLLFRVVLLVLMLLLLLLVLMLLLPLLLRFALLLLVLLVVLLLLATAGAAGVSPSSVPFHVRCVRGRPRLRFKPPRGPSLK